MRLDVTPPFGNVTSPTIASGGGSVLETAEPYVFTVPGVHTVSAACVAASCDYGSVSETLQLAVAPDELSSCYVE